MTEYAYDVKMFATIRVEANSRAQARRILMAEVDGTLANLGAWPNGEPILTEVCIEDEDLIEIDGEEVP